jgi:hypothetical protein
MTTYFGYPANGADPSGATQDTNAQITIGNSGYTTGFTCPGSGLQNIDEISAWVHKPSTAGNIRLAVYDVSRNLMAQGSAAVAVNSGPSWQGHMTSGGITTTTQLTGGTTYYIRYTKNSNVTSEYYITGSAGDFGYTEATLDIDGYSNPADAFVGSTSGRYCMRCGVSSAASIEQEGFRFRNDDGSETTATWKANQDVNITAAADTAARLRMLLNATGDPASIGAQLEYRHKPSGGSFGSWLKANS